MSQNLKRPERTETAKRPERVPMHRKGILTAKGRPGYVRRFVNEEIGRVDDFLAAGWSLVCGDEDTSTRSVQTESGKGSSVVRRVVNKNPNARYNTAVLMEISEDLYNEDQAAKMAELDTVEQALDPKKRRVGGADYGEFKRK